MRSKLPPQPLPGAEAYRREQEAIRKPQKLRRPRGRRQRLPAPNLPLLLDKDTARKLKIFAKIYDLQHSPEAEKWSAIEAVSVMREMGDWSEQLMDRIRLLYDAQYPKEMYVR